MEVPLLSMIGVIAMTIPQWTDAVAPTPGEMVEARRWAAAKFPGVSEPELGDATAGLVVLANNDPVQCNGRLGEPLNIAGKRYQRGLFCHANSRVVVRLPAPGKTFSAVVGVDTNRFSAGGKGSVVFSVIVGEEERFRSKMMREGMAGTPVEVALADARELVLVVEDAGDGIACDTASWAHARVTLENGSTVWLGDLPIVEGERGVEYEESLPFSFTYGGKPSMELLKTWRFEHTQQRLDKARIQHRLKYTDPEASLEVSCVVVQYLDFPTVEWTVYFKNTGAKDTPILEAIQGLDEMLRRYPFPHPPLGEFALHYNRGDSCGPSSYEPMNRLLRPNETAQIAPVGGRPTNQQFPYFNLEWLNGGVIIAVGWPGQWAIEFSRDENLELSIRAGQERTRLKLHPGEEIRTPLIVLQFWRGEWKRAQNIWRRWMLTHSMPKPGGKLPTPIALGSSYRVYHEMQNATEENQIMFINRYLEEGLKIDYWWMDAGWYVNGHERGWPHVGTWEVDKKRFPNGFKPISDYAHSKGIKILVWFEPERVHSDTWLTKNHPEWIIGGEKGGLLNLGNPETREWLTNHVDKLLTEEGIDLYRQDFNMDPLGCWRRKDAEDRQGITEIKHIVGLLAYWDELRRRHPKMLIDTCASGGRRLDLETLRRAVPLWRSDYGYEPIGNQCQTYGLSLWIPYYGAGNLACSDAYYGAGRTPIDLHAFWSCCYPSNNFSFDMRAKDNDYDALRRLFEQRREIVPNFYGDFYPLTPHSLANDVWMGWQFDRPEVGEGVVQVFRRPDSIYKAADIKLHGLDPDARYSVKNVDAESGRVTSGRELMEKGVSISIPNQPGAAVITYKKAR